MRFISKSSNLMVVLSPGIQAQPLTGTPARPTVSVRFKDGIADVPDGELTTMMLGHPGFNTDFITAEVPGRDPYAGMRQPNEPAHIQTELQFGTPGKTIKDVVPLSPELKKTIEDAAKALAKEMLPGMVESALKTLVEAHEKSDEPSGPTKEEGGLETPKPRGR